MPTAIVAAAKPATPAPRMTTRAQRTPGTPADQDAAAAAGPHEVVRAHERRHAPGHLAHGRQERQRVVLLAHGLVGDGHVAGGDERVGALA